MEKVLGFINKGQKNHLILKTKGGGCRDGAFDALTQDWSLVPSPDIGFTTAHNSSSRRSDAHFWSLQVPGRHMIHRHTCRQNNLKNQRAQNIFNPEQRCVATLRPPNILACSFQLSSHLMTRAASWPEQPRSSDGSFACLLTLCVFKNWRTRTSPVLPCNWSMSLFSCSDHCPI